jgi:hypothetical protein
MRKDYSGDYSCSGKFDNFIYTVYIINTKIFSFRFAIIIAYTLMYIDIAIQLQVHRTHDENCAVRVINYGPQI